MTFLEAREALHNGKKIRHEFMPKGHSLMVYLRGFGDGMIIFVDADENLSSAHVDFSELFWSALHDEEGWEVCGDDELDPLDFGDE